MVLLDIQTRFDQSNCLVFFRKGLGQQFFLKMNQYPYFLSSSFQWKFVRPESPKFLYIYDAVLYVS